MKLAADSNVYVYLFDDRFPEKQDVARVVTKTFESQMAVISLQVVGEVHNVLRKRLRMPSDLAAQLARHLFMTLPSIQYDSFCVDRALIQSEAGRLSYWDALLLSACDFAGVDVLFSEGMQDGFLFGGVRVVNPFAVGGMSKAAREILEL